MILSPSTKLRYLAGAIICAGINTVILIAVDCAGLPDIVGVMIAWLFGGTIGYFWHNLVTFRQRPAIIAFAQFMTGMLIGIPLTWLSILIFRYGIGWSMALSSPATTLVLIAYNYLNARFAILTRRGNLAAHGGATDQG